MESSQLCTSRGGGGSNRVMNATCLGENLECDERFGDKSRCDLGLSFSPLHQPVPAYPWTQLEVGGQWQGSMDPHGHHMESDSWAIPAPLGALGLRAGKGWQGIDEGERRRKRGEKTGLLNCKGKTPEMSPSNCDLEDGLRETTGNHSPLL